MKLARENIYINLQGKSKEERFEIAKYLLSINEKCECYIHIKIQRLNTLEYFKNKWFTDYGAENKQEVTIQQLKEILQPMETKFKPIAMKCTQEQFEAIKPKLKGLKIISINDFESYNYLVNNIAYIKLTISNVLGLNENSTRIVYEEWNEEVFLKACGIEVETIEQQLEKAEAEVNRLKEDIEESKIKKGDWVFVKNSNMCYKRSKEYNSFLNETKITDQDLINKLNELIK